MENLVKGNIVNEFDEIVGSYSYITSNRYWVDLYGTKQELTRKEMVEKVNKLELYFEPNWN